MYIIARAVHLHRGGGGEEEEEAHLKLHSLNFTSTKAIRPHQPPSSWPSGIRDLVVDLFLGPPSSFLHQLDQFFSIVLLPSYSNEVLGHFRELMSP